MNSIRSVVLGCFPFGPPHKTGTRDLRNTKVSIHVKQIEIYKRISQQRFYMGNFKNKFLYLGHTYFPLDPPFVTKKSCTFYTTCPLEFQC